MSARAGILQTLTTAAIQIFNLNTETCHSLNSATVGYVATLPVKVAPAIDHERAFDADAAASIDWMKCLVQAWINLAKQ